MKSMEKKRQFLREIISGKTKIEDYNLKTFEVKKLNLDELSNEDLLWIADLYDKYSSQVKNDVLNTSVLSPEDLIKYREIAKQFTYQ